MRIITIIIAVAVLVVILLLTRPDRQSELGSLPPPFVHVGNVEQMDVQALNIITGKLQPARKAHLRFEVAGRIITRHIEPGQTVAAGELLLAIDNGDFTDAVADAGSLLEQEKSAIKRDRKLLDLAAKATALRQREMERIKQLGQDSLASKSRLDEVSQALFRQMEEEARLRQMVESAGSRLTYRHAALNRASRNLDRSRLTAPFDATVNTVAVEIGDYVSPGQAAVDLIQLSELDLYLEASSRHIASLALGQQVTVRMNDQHRRGEIIALATDPDPATHTHALRIRVNGQNLYPGQLMQVELAGEFVPQAAVVPTTAILQDDGRSFVFHIEDNTLTRVAIETGPRVGDIQVVNGIAPGTRIIVRDVAALADGQEVTLAK